MHKKKVSFGIQYDIIMWSIWHPYSTVYPEYYTRHSTQNYSLNKNWENFNFCLSEKWKGKEVLVIICSIQLREENFPYSPPTVFEEIMSPVENP